MISEDDWLPESDGTPGGYQKIKKIKPQLQSKAESNQKDCGPSIKGSEPLKTKIKESCVKATLFIFEMFFEGSFFEKISREFETAHQGCQIFDGPANLLSNFMAVVATVI